MDKPTLVILAAGMGSRYGGLKQMDPMGPNGETVLDYSVYDAARAGFGSVTFIIRPDFADLFKQQVTAKFADKIPVRFAYQELTQLPAGFSVPAGREKPWGTGHAVLCARDAVPGRFAAINADDFYGADSYRQLARFLTADHDESRRAQFCMVGFRLDQTLSAHGSVARGICVTDAAGRLRSVNEMTKIVKTAAGAENQEAGNAATLSGAEPVSMNMWGFTPRYFDFLETAFAEFLRAQGGELKSEFFIPKHVDAIVQAGLADCRVLTTDSAWFGVTYREDRPLVMENIRRLIAAGAYPERLWA
ncbi:MAG: NTP transferase domain-containing protein [Verrucomicrobiales bacterium]|jgi:UTP-glucose-1-phosphate uridylyltransferase|nr:NTP transferase domain-containing protein [Verrucomicrobiales bacterium]